MATSSMGAEIALSHLPRGSAVLSILTFILEHALGRMVKNDRNQHPRAGCWLSRAGCFWMKLGETAQASGFHPHSDLHLGMWTSQMPEFETVFQATAAPRQPERRRTQQRRIHRRLRDVENWPEMALLERSLLSSIIASHFRPEPSPP
jgi:hypothetical protein